MWHRVLAPDELAEGGVKTVACAGVELCLTRHQGRYGALAAECPHRGGPLGEGAIEDGVLRCPWHGFGYDPISGAPAQKFGGPAETHPVEERPDGVYVSLAAEADPSASRNP